MKRAHSFKLALSGEELGWLRAMAAADGLSLAEWLRREIRAAGERSPAPLRSKWTPAQFNAAHQVGTAVRFQPVAGVERYEDTRTRSLAWALGNGEPVVMVEGRTGCVSLAHLTVPTLPPLTTIRTHAEGCKAYAHKAFLPELCDCGLVTR